MIPRCVNCGCLAGAHVVDDEERRECTECEREQFEADLDRAELADDPAYMDRL